MFGSSSYHAAEAHAPSTVFEAQSAGAQNTPDSQACTPRSRRSGHKSSIKTKKCDTWTLSISSVSVEKHTFFLIFWKNHQSQSWHDETNLVAQSTSHSCGDFLGKSEIGTKTHNFWLSTVNGFKKRTLRCLSRWKCHEMPGKTFRWNFLLFI